ncbi:filamentous hemagglutinin N-terminal domain-containing protein [Nostoc punctiforme FACHB-252]|uniref:Filamentous hemagglutinin N-terminal domain-containing protein n=1 Tax=Nostoc punctiforme FACHB-252 TaxID=1357509 RepID=A0ABR8HJT9_NOSPU|nr:filamentous hemagglutinin N-terminal domain-containing protein [Nostoc punctiforme]MBD2616069.1 filamentous hemagglutinin N-terminal domain-containing protein [Nostoc punctiforme FACHB-252]
MSNAEITPDKTLLENSTTRLDDNTIVIEGGTKTGDNLFHSFENFSVPIDITAYFNNPLDTQNIISRVTGTSVSNINGLIRVNGTANLFLINPNGIVFGQNARLDIGGSFVGSTANTIRFTDGFQFIAKNSQIKPLLTISVPVGLQFNKNQGTITVRNTGHTLKANDYYSPLNYEIFSNALQVKADRTLALIGGNIFLEGGIISSNNGRIELGSINSGEVNINFENNLLSFIYDKNSAFQDIQLSDSALIYAGNNQGVGKNTINLQGREVRILDGSVLLNQDYGSRQNGNVSINSSEYFILKNFQPEQDATGIFSVNFGRNSGTNIIINSNKTYFEQSQIATATFSNGSSGNIIINTDFLELIGTGEPDSSFNGSAGINTFTYSSGSGGNITGKIGNLIENYGVIATAALSSGNAGKLDITAENILLQNGSNIGSITFASGNSGNVSLNANGNIKIIGQLPSFKTNSAINSATYGSGYAGDLTINSFNLFVLDGASVTTSTLSSGDAGNITIKTVNSIKVLGTSSDSLSFSTVASSAPIVNETLQIAYKVPPTPTGKAGSITLDTPYLNITDGAQVTVRNEGPGNAGTLQINADRISITNTGGITATTAIGEGGDIDIKSKLLQLRSGTISATAGTAGTSGNGGNIRIATGILSASNNSAITANAYRGRGGNIRINTKGLFVSPDTQITTSSELGIDGTVQINFQNGNLSTLKVQLQDLAKTPEVASVCQGDSDGVASSFVNSGTGGVPANFDNQLDNSSTWQKNSVWLESIDNSEQLNPLTTKEPIEIVEAQGWILNANGNVVLTAQANPPNPYAQVSASKCQEQPSTAKVSSVTEIRRN